jgi:5-methylcytosine-specific restriction enzyme subunit McrC
MRVMLNLLRVSDFNNVLRLSNQTSFAEQSDIMEVLISIFTDKVIELYSRKMNREYITKTENSAFIKGRIDFQANIRENPFRKDLHVVSYQNFEHDNIINNVIKTVCLRLLKLTNSSDNKKQLKKALVFLDDAQEIALYYELFTMTRFSRLNMIFKPVFDLAKMFFYNMSPSSYQGDDTVSSFLIPLNDLFEFYIYKLFDSFDEDMYATYQNSSTFARGFGNDFRMNIRPDIILSQDNEPILIADAKYKNPGFQNGLYKNISSDDIYQVYSYANVLEINTVALIYPAFESYNTPVMTVELGDNDNIVNMIILCIDIKDSNIESKKKKLFSMLIESNVKIRNVEV